MDVIDQYRNFQQVLQDHAVLAGPERIIRDRVNPFELFGDAEFVRRFRFSKENVIYIIDLVYNEISPISRKYQDIPPHLQVLIALQYFATGAFQITVGDLTRIHQTTVSRIVKRVSVALARKRRRFIRFPDRQTSQQVMEQFNQIADLPRVIAAMDCTHIKISNPGGDDSLRFINRKGFFSLNCQYTCNADMVFTSIVARWPGSTHDSRIFRESNLCRDQERNNNDGRNGVILGDAGYPLLPYLMTPLNNPNTPAQRH